MYNNAKLLLAAVDSLRNLGGERLGNLIIVDDASDDKDVAKVAIDYGKYFRNSKNLGFAASCNFGFRQTRTPWIAFVNSDVVATEGWLDAILDPTNDPDVAVVGPLLLFVADSKDPSKPAGMVQSCGFAYNFELQPYHRFIGWSPKNAKVKTRRDDLQGITGAVLLIRRSTWIALNGFEPLYISYFEDADFCLRAKALGKKIAYAPESVFYHHVNASTRLAYGDGSFLMQRNAQLFHQKAAGRLKYDEWLVLS